MRVAVLLEERCKPNSNAFAYLKKYSEMCERECIQVEGSKCKILETACPVCFTRAKHCPDGAVKIINLPEELDTDLTHSYGENAFRLFRLPSPRQEQIVGILGPNGIGKSTAIPALIELYIIPGAKYGRKRLLNKGPSGLPEDPEAPSNLGTALPSEP